MDEALNRLPIDRVKSMTFNTICVKSPQHKQGKFTDGMTWENYGKWHVDHIKPCSSFDLAQRDQQLICFHYTNLQPLWSADNARKHWL